MLERDAVIVCTNLSAISGRMVWCGSDVSSLVPLCSNYLCIFIKAIFCFLFVFISISGNAASPVLELTAGEL